MKIIFVFAHPDDESFSSAGLIAKLTKKGVCVKLITATKGEAGQVGNPPITSKENLGKTREKELRKAAKILGIKQIYFLGYTDGELIRVAKKELSQKILKIFKIEKPDAVVTFNEEGASLHPDHIQIHKAATKAFKIYIKTVNKHVRLYYTANPRKFINKLRKSGMAYNVFGKVKGTPSTRITTIVDISDTIGLKIKALKAHQTQHQDWERYLKRFEEKEMHFEFFRLALENII